jgi:predicted RecB family nuclease
MPATVKPQGGYVAKRCPARAQWDVIQPCEPLPLTPFLQRLFRHGNEFEAEVFAQLVRLHPEAVAVPGRDEAPHAAREQQTIEAMQAGAQLILGGRLPADEVGHRIGEPDILVSAPGGGYHALDVKQHLTLTTTLHASPVPARTSDFTTPSYGDSAQDPVLAARPHPEDQFQLAHYQRMLMAMGLAAAGDSAGGIIGTECVVVWHNLDAALENYDTEFAFRLDVIDAATRHLRDPSVPLLTAPFHSTECAQCPWKDWCEPILEAGSGHLSLVPRMTRKLLAVHLDHETADRAALAALDWHTASLVAKRVDLDPIMAALEGEPPDTPLAVIIGKRKWRQVERLGEARMWTLGDARKLDLHTATYSDTGMTSLPGQIDQCRALLGDEIAYRKRGVTQVTAPRGDIEVDVDVENDENGVYLWGTYTTGPGYKAFVSWDLLTPDTEAALFAEFWSWFTALRNKTHAAGQVFRAYCYNEAHENQQMRRCAKVLGLSDEVEELIASDDWVDLFKVFKDQMITGNPVKLKVTAPLCGHSWGVEEPAGDESMVRHDTAIEGSQEDRDWLLTYNRGDVEATAAVREWLDHEASSYPSVEDLEADS